VLDEWPEHCQDASASIWSKYSVEGPLIWKMNKLRSLDRVSYSSKKKDFRFGKLDDAKRFAMNRQGGDDLEDDFVPDDLVAFDDDEGYSAIAGSSSHLLSEEEESGGQDAELAKKQNSVEKKRKRKKEKEKKAKVGRLLLVLG
jgi:hypothetical protein